MYPHFNYSNRVAKSFARLENLLRNYAALGEDETIAINYNKKIYPLRVVEVRPKHITKGVSIIETDLDVDFAPIEGEEEVAAATANVAEAQKPASTAVSVKSQESAGKQEKVFTGKGYTLSGKKLSSIEDDSTN
jgi:ubiquitin fusion degradation protein 1